jgi:hypothetical protein
MTVCPPSAEHHHVLRERLCCLGSSGVILSHDEDDWEGTVAQITEPQRIERIQGLIRELNKVPPERHEVARLPWSGGEPLLCPVIKIGVDEVLLNHRSHRLRSQLEDDPEWKELRKDPHSEPAQRVLERHVRDARKAEQFAALKESLLQDGQTDAGVMTHSGVLVNANTRAVAIREFEDPGRRYIRVAVLPPTAQSEELALLELRLQMQKELKVEYSLTNELLFIEELSNERHLSDAQIARELRIFPESERKGENEVRLRLRMLDLIREMQRIPDDEPLHLTFFDTLSYEQLREVHRLYHPLLERGPDEARRYLESFLLSVAVGVTPVHQIRHIDAAFMSDYMLPQLEEDEVVGEVADRLAAPEGNGMTEVPAGAEALLVKTGENEPAPVDVKRLINVVTNRDKRVEVDGTPLVLERDDVKEAIKAAVITGIKEKKRDERDADKLAAPIDSIKAATRELTKGQDAVKAVANDPDFDQKHRKSLEAAFNKFKRATRDLEAALAKAKVLGG